MATTPKKPKADLVGRDTEGAKSFGRRVVDAATEAGIEVHSEVKSMTGAEQLRALEAHQGVLPGTLPKIKPMVVVDGKMICEMNRPIYSTQEGEKYIELEFSMPLEAAHRIWLPQPILKSWDFLIKKHAEAVSKILVSEQTIDVHLATDVDPSIHFTAVPITKCELKFVEQTGEGKIEKVLRLIFRVRVPHTKPNCEFADAYYDNKVWLSLGDAQGEFQE